MPAMQASSSSSVADAAVLRAALAPRFESDGSDLLRFGSIIPLHRSANGAFTCPLKRPVNLYLGAARTQSDLEMLIHVFRPDAIALACDSTAEFVAARGPANVSPFERKSLFDTEPEQTVAIRDERSVTYLFRREPLGGTRPMRRDDRFEQVVDYVIVPPTPGFAFVSETTLLSDAPIKLKH